MKDEIKKAIDNLNGVVKGIYRMDEAGLDIKNIEILLDYITNLQKENEKLKQPQIFIDTMDMEERYGQELYEDYLKEQLEDYKSRNKKAIDLLEPLIDLNGTMTAKGMNKLLMILQGENKDE